jgi:anti-anti-sigma factor
LDVDVEKGGDIAVVLLSEETLEASNLDDFRDRMEPVLEQNARVVFDMSRVRFIDSMACGPFYPFSKSCNKKGRTRNLLHDSSSAEPLHAHGV